MRAWEREPGPQTIAVARILRDNIRATDREVEALVETIDEDNPPIPEVKWSTVAQAFTAVDLKNGGAIILALAAMGKSYINVMVVGDAPPKKSSWLTIKDLVEEEDTTEGEEEPRDYGQDE